MLYRIDVLSVQVIVWNAKMVIALSVLLTLQSILNIYCMTDSAKVARIYLEIIANLTIVIRNLVVPSV